jgi:transposase
MRIPTARDYSGVLNATAFIAAIGNARVFVPGRDLAAWLGLVPRQITTGGVWSASPNAAQLFAEVANPRRQVGSADAPDQRNAARWLVARTDAARTQAAGVAPANKLARIVWAVLRRGEEFDAAAVRPTA